MKPSDFSRQIILTAIAIMAVSCTPKIREADVIALISEHFNAQDSHYRSGIPVSIADDYQIDTIFRDQEGNWIYEAIDRGWAFSKKLKVENIDDSLTVTEITPVYGCDITVSKDQVQPGENFISLMARLGVDNSMAFRLLSASGDQFDARRMQAGKDVEICRKSSPESDSSVVTHVIYSDGKITSTIFQCEGETRVWKYSKPVNSERKTADVVIKTSLWNDMLESGTSPLLIVELADIYAWTVNFFALQGGDRFRVIYDQSSCEGEVVRVDSVEFCIYDTPDTSIIAVRFDQHDGKSKYWNEKGESMKKAFLKAPLQYNRISSRFTYHRKHPITGKVRPHTGVDYAAPKGTPVHAIGNGTVTLCGWDGSGGGKRIKIKHMNGYETSYMHLSRFASGIKAGSRVTQGQTIGYVGSTGHSTGPHLDFRVWKNGKPIDPLKMISPPSEPLNAANLDSLKTLVSRYSKELSQK